jgi:hypothetical protein
MGEQIGELAPLAIVPAAPHRQRYGLQMLERRDFGLQFLDGPGGGGLIKDLFLGGGDFVVRGFVQIFDIFLIQCWTLFSDRLSDSAALEQFELAQALLKTLTTAAQ